MTAELLIILQNTCSFVKEFCLTSCTLDMQTQKALKDWILFSTLIIIMNNELHSISDSLPILFNNVINTIIFNIVEPLSLSVYNLHNYFIIIATPSLLLSLSRASHDNYLRCFCNSINGNEVKNNNYTYELKIHIVTRYRTRRFQCSGK